MPSKQPDFATVIGELLRQQGTICAICESPERESIEAAKKAGAPNSLVAQALQMTGAIDPNLTRDTAAKRVRVHFDAHVPKETA